MNAGLILDAMRRMSATELFWAAPSQLRRSSFVAAALYVQPSTQVPSGGLIVGSSCPSSRWCRQHQSWCCASARATGVPPQGAAAALASILEVLLLRTSWHDHLSARL